MYIYNNKYITYIDGGILVSRTVGELHAGFFFFFFWIKKLGFSFRSSRNYFLIFLSAISRDFPHFFLSCWSLESFLTTASTETLMGSFISTHGPQISTPTWQYHSLKNVKIEGSFILNVFFPSEILSVNNSAGYLPNFVSSFKYEMCNK